MIWNRFIKRNPWKFIGNKKVFVSIENIYKNNNSNFIIIDVRNKCEYLKIHLKDSSHLEFYKLKSYILSRNKRDKILIISENKRTYMWLVSWARSQNYKHIYLLDKMWDPKLDEKFLIKA